MYKVYMCGLRFNCSVFRARLEQYHRGDGGTRGGGWSHHGHGGTTLRAAESGPPTAGSIPIQLNKHTHTVNVCQDQSHNYIQAAAGHSPSTARQTYTHISTLVITYIGNST